MKPDQKPEEIDYLNEILDHDQSDDYVHKSSKSVKFDPFEGAAERLKLLRSPYAKLVLNPLAHKMENATYGAIDKRGHFYSVMEAKFVKQTKRNYQRNNFKDRSTTQINKYWDELQERVRILNTVQNAIKLPTF